MTEKPIDKKRYEAWLILYEKGDTPQSWAEFKNFLENMQDEMQDEK